MKLMQEEIYKLADGEFNILSPKQLGEVLFEKLKIEYPKKRKRMILAILLVKIF